MGLKFEKIVFYVLALIMFICIIVCCIGFKESMKNKVAANKKKIEIVDEGLGYSKPEKPITLEEKDKLVEEQIKNAE